MQIEQAEKNSKNMVRILLIGCGQIATFAHLPSLIRLQELGQIEIAGVCDVDLERAKSVASQFNIAHAGTDWKQMVTATNANAVSACLPPGPNAEISVQAIEMGLHVICEKPPGRTVQQAERMATAAADHPELVNMIAFNRRHAPLYVRAIQDSLKFGQPHTFYGRFTRPSLGANPSNTVKDWITSDGSHSLDLAIATIGFPHRVSVARQQVGSGADNVWTIQLHAATASAVLLLDFTAGRRVERFEWSGAGYDVLLELPDRAEWCQQGEETQHWAALDLTQTDSFPINYGFLGEYQDFVDAILGTSPRPQADFQYGVAFMHLVRTILECASGELRQVPPLENRNTATASEQVSERLSESLDRSISHRPVVQIMQSPAGQTRFFDLESLSHLSEHCDVRTKPPQSEHSYDLSQTNVLVTGWAAQLPSPEELAQAEQLKLVVLIGASVAALQPKLLVERNILVCNTADAIAQSVAEHCLLSALAGLRRLTEVNQKLHAGGWSTAAAQPAQPSMVKVARQIPGIHLVKPLLIPIAIKILSRRPTPKAAPPLTFHDLQGQVVGLIGWGYTARYFAQLLQPFQCKLLICSDAIAVDELAALNARRASLSEVLGSAKVISLHKGLTPESQGMIGARELALIQSGSVFINTARGGLIDEAALIERAKRADIAIALDVFQDEPLPAPHPLRELNNVILTPHNASTTAECDRRVGQQALDIVRDWLAGKPVPALTSARLEKMT